jgi:hypothetical protein
MHHQTSCASLPVAAFQDLTIFRNNARPRAASCLEPFDQHPPGVAVIESLCVAATAAGASPLLEEILEVKDSDALFRLSSLHELRTQLRDNVVLPLVDLLCPAEVSNTAHISLLRHQRFQAALALASSYLYLHQTPWLVHGWNKCNMLLQPSIATPSPLVYLDAEAVTTTHSSLSNVPPSVAAAAGACQCDEAEMMQQQLLLQQDTNGRSLHSLGIVLLEL